MWIGSSGYLLLLSLWVPMKRFTYGIKSKQGHCAHTEQRETTVLRENFYGSQANLRDRGWTLGLDFFTLEITDTAHNRILYSQAKHLKTLWVPGFTFKDC